MFNKYFRQDYGYNRKLLQVLGILLNERSSIQEKSKILFEVYDDSSNYTLDRIQTTEML